MRFESLEPRTVLSAVFFVGPPLRVESLLARHPMSFDAKATTLDLFAAKLDAQLAATTESLPGLNDVGNSAVLPPARSLLIVSPATMPTFEAHADSFTKSVDTSTVTAEMGKLELGPAGMADRFNTTVPMVMLVTDLPQGTLTADVNAGDWIAGPKVGDAKFTSMTLSSARTLPSDSNSEGWTLGPMAADAKLASVTLSSMELRPVAVDGGLGSRPVDSASYKLGTLPGSGSDVVALTPSSEGGWVVLGATPVNVVHRRVGEIVLNTTRLEATAPPSGGAVASPAGGNVSFQVGWGGPWNLGDPRVKLNMPTRDVQSVPVVSGSASEGGYVAIPPAISGETGASIGSWTVAARSAQDLRLGQSYAESLGTHGVWIVDLAQEPTGGNYSGAVAQSRRPSVEIAGDGGFVEIGSTRAGVSRSPGRAQGGPASELIASMSRREVLDGLWQTLDDRDDFWDGSRIALDEGLVPDEADVAPATDAGDVQAFAQAFVSEEGGLVNLVVAYPASGSARGEIDLPRMPSGPVLGVRGIRMDNGVGRYRAFDLAAAPAERVDAGIPTAKSASDAERAASEPVAQADDLLAAEPSSDAKTSEEQPLHATAAIPAIAIASLLAPQGRAFGRRSVALAAGLMRWLGWKKRDDRE